MQYLYMGPLVSDTIATDESRGLKSTCSMPIIVRYLSADVWMKATTTKSTAVFTLADDYRFKVQNHENTFQLFEHQYKITLT